MSQGKTALLIIDAQENMFDEEMPIHQADQVLSNLQTLCKNARSACVPIIYVRHNGDEGDVDEPGTAGWQLHHRLDTQDDDIYIDKTAPSAFHETLLRKKLTDHKINRLIIAGMQTEVCINATTREAVDYGFDVTVVSDSHSTFDDETKSAAELISEYNATFGKLAATKPVSEIEF